MIESYRLFNCNRCRVQVRICQRCDRGNIYCPTCASQARKESKNRAGAKYQKTERGKEKHAVRQQRYLDNKERVAAAQQTCCTCVESQKMTHHGSPIADGASPLSAQPEVCETSVLKQENAHVHYQLQSPSRALDHAAPSHAPADIRAIAGPDSTGVTMCDFCGQLCGPYTRLEFLHTPS